MLFGVFYVDVVLLCVDLCHIVCEPSLSEDVVEWLRLETVDETQTVASLQLLQCCHDIAERFAVYVANVEGLLDSLLGHILTCRRDRLRIVPNVCGTANADSFRPTEKHFIYGCLGLPKMVEERLAAVRKRIEALATAAGEYYVICGRTGQRPVPVGGLSFPDRETAGTAAQTATAYRSLLREYDPEAPMYDFIVCQHYSGATEWPVAVSQQQEGDA